MKETLQIHHIAKRLPYGVKALDYEYNIIFDICSYRKDLEEWLIHDNIDGSVEEYSRDILKPILFPLCLTQEITVNGETFVPIVELFKIARGNFDMSIRHISIMSSNWMKIEMLGHRDYHFRLIQDEGDVRLGDGFSFEMFSTNLNSEDKRTERVLFNNLLFEKLIEWHIDLPNENLIEKGLAISVLDLDKNPYA